MNLFNKFHITLSGNPYLFFLGFFLILIYTIYVYKFTVPVINKFYKTLLILLRTTVLSLLLLLLFDPVISITKKIKVEPTNLIFIDNSKSISQFTEPNTLAEIKNLTKDFFSRIKGKNKIVSFGKKTKEIPFQQIDSLKFDEPSTRLNFIKNYITKFKNVSSVTIISDGIINEGKIPATETEKLGIPFYTILVGDTTNFKDIEITSLRSNEFIYPGNKTEIEATITNTGFSDEPVSVKLLENNKIIKVKNISLSSTGINRVQFSYSTKLVGQHNLTVIVSSKNKEENKKNNRKTTIINVLETKKKIILLSGSPSYDLATIKSSIINNNDFNIQSIIQLSSNKFYKNEKDFNKIKEADILLLVNFPSANTGNLFISKVIESIKNFNKPFLFCFSNNTDLSKLKLFNNLLPFKFSNENDLSIESQVKPANFTNSILGSTEQLKEEWKNLPPIIIANAKITPNISSEILLKSSTKNQLPVIFTNNIAGRKSVIINAANIWKWKLKAQHKEYRLFDNFILNSIKWLSSQNDKSGFTVKPNKKDFKLGESVLFTASVYDETFAPVNNANIVLEISNSNKKQTLEFTSVNNGLYEVKFEPNNSGEYKYSGKLLLGGEKTKNVKGKFYIEPVELELYTSKANKELLHSLAEKTSGKYFTIRNSKKLPNELNKKYNLNVKYKYQDNKLHLSVLDFILLLIVLIFSTEWLIRKILRML